MISSSNSSTLKQLRWFYNNQIRERNTEGTMPKFAEIERELVSDIRAEFRSGSLTGGELDRLSNRVGDDDARAFLNRLASNPNSRELKFQLTAEGISLTDDSDVGPRQRFETLQEKAAYIGSRYAYTIEKIFPYIITFGWGFVDQEFMATLDKKQLNNSIPHRGRRTLRRRARS